MKSSIYLTLLLTLLVPAISPAIDENLVREKLHTPFGLYLTPHEAYNMKKTQGDKVLLVDIRTLAELRFIGATEMIDANIPSRFLNPEFPWSKKFSTYQTYTNDNFAADFEKLLTSKNLDKSTPIILICQSGSRVPWASRRLHEAGFENVYSQYQGFEGIKAKTGVLKGQRLVNGWKNGGLPWSYRLKKEAMYFNFDSSKTKGPD